uniref:Uncharacterized protein n=1 Tax=Arundo donax TaxID=35708 RepID=A0A0A9AFG5_ARUDO
MNMGPHFQDQPEPLFSCCLPVTCIVGLHPGLCSGMSSVQWCLHRIHFSPLTSIQVTRHVFRLEFSVRRSCQPSVVLLIFSASILHAPLSVAVIAFASLIVHEAVSAPPFASLELLPLVNSSFCLNHCCCYPTVTSYPPRKPSCLL